MCIKTMTSSLCALLIFSTTVQAEEVETFIAENMITANEWQSIQEQIINDGSFLNDEQKQKIEEGSGVPEHTVLSGTLGLTDYIKAFNTDAGDQFGFNIDIKGNVLVVGAAGEDSNGLGGDGSPFSNNLANSGGVYVFRRGAGGWQQEAYLKASNPDENDEFGYSVALDGNRIVVGAIREDSNTLGVNSTPNNISNNSGAAYIFELIGGIWQEVAYLKASNTGVDDFFGHDVDISGNTVTVSALNEDSSTRGINPSQNNSLFNSGAVYIFEYESGEWTQQVFVKASNPDSRDFFGARIDLDQNTLIVGAPQEDSSATQINGGQGNHINTGQSFGAAYVFNRTGSEWIQQAYLKAVNSAPGDHYGESVAIRGDLAVVGARFEDGGATGVDGFLFDNSVIDAGAAYVYRRNSVGVWRFLAYLKANNPGANDEFGTVVEISDNFIVVGSMREDSSSIEPNGDDNNDRPGAGAAYVYQVVGNDVEFVSALKASPADAGDFFGIGVAASGTGLAIGARDEDSISTGVNGDSVNNNAIDAGAVYLFQTISTFHPISGVVTGSAEGNSVTLQNNGEDVITVDANGEFRFPGLFVEGETYDVLVAEDGFPVNPHQDCSIENGSGVLDDSAVGSIVVQCTLKTLSINQNLNTVNQAVVNVPVQFAPEGESIAVVEFSLDYDQSCLNPDVDNDGVLDSININVPDEFTTTVSFNPDQTDAEIDVVIADLSLPFSVLGAGDVVDIDFSVDCPESQNTSLLESMVSFSAANPPSFSDLSANEVEGAFQDGIVRVWASVVGDCNASGTADLAATDLASLVLEIADDDGTNFIDAPESDNFGSPQGCDANSNEQINVADLACLTRLLGNDACEPLRVVTRTYLKIARTYLKIAI